MTATTETLVKIVQVPLNRLVPFKGNVRKTTDKEHVKRLAASIKSHGLRQNLNVIKQGRNFAVVAGRQRHEAMLLLREEGYLKAAHPVPCHIAEGEIDPVEISLMENTIRADMHPADVFEAVRVIVDRGEEPLADIAARFGRSEGYLRDLLKLSRVSPVILKAYREGKLTLDQVKAFAISDDHAAQETVYKNLKPFNRDPRSIRAALTQGEIPATDRRVKFVTVSAYEKTGGQTRIDFFTEGEGRVYILDAPLLTSMATGKLEGIAQTVGKEGWKWVEFGIEFTYEQKSRFQRVNPAAKPLPGKLAKEAEKLEKERGRLQDDWENAETIAKYPARIREIDQRLGEIEDSRETAWTPEQLAMAGAFVTIGDNGKAEILRGLVRPEDMPKKKGKKAKAKSGKGAANDDQSHGLTAALVESLSAQKSAALAAELAQRPDIALAAVVHSFASRVFLHGAHGALQVSMTPQSLGRVKGSKAFTRMEAAHAKWSRMLPKADALWKWCLDQKQEVLLELLAFCAAVSVNAVQCKNDRDPEARLKNADALAAALKLDMKAWFTPDAPNYFIHVGKAQILDALTQGRKQPNAPAWDKLKKPELAVLAERELAGRGWLPEMLRPAA